MSESQELSNQRPHSLLKEGASSKSLTHVPVLIPYFKVQHIEDYPLEVLSNILQDERDNALSKLLKWLLKKTKK